MQSQSNKKYSSTVHESVGVAGCDPVALVNVSEQFAQLELELIRSSEITAAQIAAERADWAKVGAALGRIYQALEEGNAEVAAEALTTISLLLSKRGILVPPSPKVKCEKWKAESTPTVDLITETTTDLTAESSEDTGTTEDELCAAHLDSEEETPIPQIETDFGAQIQYGMRNAECGIEPLQPSPLSEEETLISHSEYRIQNSSKASTPISQSANQLISQSCFDFFEEDQHGE